MIFLPYMHGSPYNALVYTGQLPNVPVRSSFSAPTPSTLSDSRSKTDDLGSTTSESSSPVSSVVATSVCASNMEDDSDSVRTDPVIGPSRQCDYQLYPVYMQAPVPEAYGLTYGPQHYQNFPTSLMGAVIPNYVNMLPYQPQQEPITTSQMCPLQFQNVVYPGQLHQRLAKAQNLSSVRASTVLSSEGNSMLYPQNSEPITGTVLDGQQASSNLFANGVSSTPSEGCSGIPDYVNSYGYVNSSAVPSHSCTPMSGIIQSSIVPPTFHPSNNIIYSNIPDQISCNINTAPVSTISKTETTYRNVCEASKPYGTDVENL